MTKVCFKCKVEKSLDDFYKDKNGIKGVFVYCKECDNIRHKDYLKRNPDSTKDKHLRQRFGLSIALRQEMLDIQNGLCKICGTDNPGSRGWQVDHDHNCCPGRYSCGKCIRGLLCISCNKGLGDFKDNINNLKQAVIYLESQN